MFKHWDEGNKPKVPYDDVKDAILRLLEQVARLDREESKEYGGLVRYRTPRQIALALQAQGGETWNTIESAVGEFAAAVEFVSRALNYYQSQGAANLERQWLDAEGIGGLAADAGPGEAPGWVAVWRCKP